MSKTLFEIGADMVALDELLEEAGGDVTEVEAIIDQWIAENKAQLKSKIDGYGAYISELDAQEAALKKEARKHRNKARTIARRRKALKTRLMIFLARRNRKTIEGHLYRMTRRKAGGKRSLTVLVDDKDLPDWARIDEVRHKANKEALRDALEAGSEEVLALARLEERSEYLAIS